MNVERRTPPLHVNRRTINVERNSLIFNSFSLLTTLAVRDPRGANYACTTRDLSLLVLSKLRFVRLKKHIHPNKNIVFNFFSPSIVVSCKESSYLRNK